MNYHTHSEIWRKDRDAGVKTNFETEEFDDLLKNEIHIVSAM